MRVKSRVIVFLLFATLTVWWIFLAVSGVKESFHNYLFGAVYGLVAAFGGIAGLVIAKKYGGLKSTLGKALMLLSAGLLAAEFGQLVFSYYNIVKKVEVPYPSAADIGFFANIPLYSLGIVFIAKAAGAKISLKSLINKLLAFLIPVALVGLTYYFVFLKGIEIQGFSLPAYGTPEGSLVEIILAYGYPLGQTFYISLAIVAYLLSRKVLGGVMKNKILLILLAFVVQYVADYNFLYQATNETWVNGGYGDYLYLLAYFIMALGLLSFSSTDAKPKAPVEAKTVEEAA